MSSCVTREEFQLVLQWRGRYLHAAHEDSVWESNIPAELLQDGATQTTPSREWDNIHVSMSFLH